jgi:hypothetical protein
MAELKGQISGGGMGGSVAGRRLGGGAVPVLGKSAYDLAVAQGFDGTLEEWLESLKGRGISDIVYIENRNGYAIYDIIFTDGTTQEIQIPAGGGGASIKTIAYTQGDNLVAIPEGATEVTVTGTCGGYKSGDPVYFVLVDNSRNIIDYSQIGSGADTNILDVFATLDIPDNAVYFGTHPFMDGQYNDSRNEGYSCNLSAAFNIVAKGKDGITPHIGENKNWWIGETDTGVKAEGKDGKDGADGADGADGKDGAKGADGKTPYIQNGYWYIDGANTNVKAEGKDGANGTDGEDGKDGTNGKDGANGVDGVSPTVSVSTITGGHRITITDKNGTKTVDIMDGSDGADGNDGADGSKGADGRGIKTVARTSGTGAAGTTDTYTITYTDNTTSTFTVYNGKNGADGKSIDRISYMASGTDSAGRVEHYYDVFAGGQNSIGSFTVTNGLDGVDGYSPARGTDYWTEADKAEIKSYVDNAILGGAW